MKKFFLARRIISITIIVGILYAFYTSPFHSHVESVFFDLKSIVKPNTYSPKDIVIVDIDDKFFSLSTKKNSDEQYSSLIGLLKLINSAQPLITTAVYLDNFFDINDTANKQELINIFETERNTFIGTFRYHYKFETTKSYPPEYNRYLDKLSGVDTLRERSNGIVRSLPLWGYLEKEKVYMLPALIAQHLGVDLDSVPDQYRLNFIRTKNLKIINASKLVENQKSLDGLSGKVVVVGLKKFLPWKTASIEQTYVNTPLVGKDHNTYKTGQPIHHLVAIAIDNLTNARYVSPENKSISIIIGLCAVAAIYLLFKALSGSLATLLSLGVLAIIFLCQSILIETHSILVSFVESFVFSFIALVYLSANSLKTVIHDFAESTTNQESKKSIASIQTRFLDNFASEIKNINKQFYDEIKKIKFKDTAPEVFREVQEKIFLSSEEFDIYLTGVEDFAAAESNKAKKPKIEKIDIVDISTKVINRFAEMVKHRNIKITAHYLSKPYIKSNPQIFDTILYNFISNAIKYSPDDTTVTVVFEDSDQGFYFSVSDQGVGIADEYLQKIFERFYRIKDDLVYSVKGTGVGLYLCSYFANLIQAEISVSSTVGEGSTFTLNYKGRSYDK